MAEICLDACGSANTGLIDCEYSEKPRAGFLFMKMVASDGTKNHIPVDATFEQADLDALVNNADASKRAYPLMLIDFIVPTITAPTGTAGNFGANYFVNKRTLVQWEFRIVNAPEFYVAKLNKAISCGTWGVIEIDMDGNYYGQVSADGTKLYPKEIANGSFIATSYPADATNNTYPYGLFQWAYSISVNPLDARIFTNVTANTLGAKGLKTVTGEIGTITSTTVIVDLKVASSVANNGGIAMGGLLTADFAVKKVSDDSSVTVSSVVESSDGSYLITCTGSTGLACYIEITKTGYDFSAVKALTFTFA